jgi:alpha-methylacyl-CoA racemase
MLLADLGADVIRIDRLEPSGLGVAVDKPASTSRRATGARWRSTSSPTPGAAALRLIAQADVLIEGFRPGVAERLGLGPRPATRVNPGLVYGRMTGFGQTGPLAQAAGHDLNYIALSGALMPSAPGGKPVPPLNLVGDYGGGALYLAFGMMAAIFERSAREAARWSTRRWSTAPPRWHRSSSA